jgi:hypothetical protein
VLDRIDAALGAVFDAAGGLDRFLSHTAVIVTSDHGHCDILDDADAAVIELNDVLSGFTQAKLGSPWQDDDEIMICPNMRAAQVYVHDARRFDDVVRAALTDPRIDLVLWRERDGGAGRYRVAGPRGQLTFSQRGSASREGRDPFGTTWMWDGDPSALALQPDGRCIESADYPNAFERIAGALDAPVSGDIWLTARAGCEFAAPGGEPHVGGGSHGALHALDSLSPVICAGTDVRLPRALRSIDLAAVCLRTLGLAPPHEVGTPRIFS